MGDVEYRAVWVEKPDPSALAHHGVKGMKWGVRRTPQQLGNDISSGGGGGGGLDYDEMTDEEKQLIKELSEGDLDLGKDLRDVVNGKMVEKQDRWKDTNGNEHRRVAIWERHGNDLHVSVTYGKNGEKPTQTHDSFKNVFAKDPDKGYGRVNTKARYSKTVQQSKVKRLQQQKASRDAQVRYNASNQRNVVDRLKREKQTKEELRKRPQQWT